jgi:hypothetical protein
MMTGMLRVVCCAVMTYILVLVVPTYAYAVYTGSAILASYTPAISAVVSFNDSYSHEVQGWQILGCTSCCINKTAIDQNCYCDII